MAVVFAFAIVNSALLEPSALRTKLFRLLTGVLAVLSCAAIYKTLWP